MHLKIGSSAEVSNVDYRAAERQFTQLLHLDNLERKLAEKPALKEDFEDRLESALSDLLDGEECEPQTLLFLQRTLYRINRLKFFWYDDLENYANEDSQYIFGVQNQIESAWQDWESSHINLHKLRVLNYTKQWLIAGVRVSNSLFNFNLAIIIFQSVVSYKIQ